MIPDLDFDTVYYADATILFSRSDGAKPIIESH